MAVAPNPLAPYDIVNDVLNLARSRLNDAIQSIGGDVLKDNQPFTQAFTNGAWRRLQGFLAKLGFSRFTNETVLYSVPAAAPIPPQTIVDPATQVWLNWSQCFDGYNTFTTPLLPWDFIAPLKLWERPSAVVTVGTAAPNTVTAPTNFLLMDRMLNGIPNLPKIYRNWSWAWRNDTLYLAGATVATDLRISYQAYLPDFIQTGEVDWFQQPVAISRAKDSLAWYVCFEVASSRGDLNAADLEQKAMAAAQELYDLDLAQPNAMQRVAEAGKMRDVYTPASPTAPVKK